MTQFVLLLPSDAGESEFVATDVVEQKPKREGLTENSVAEPDTAGKTDAAG
jgi:hypothetical protein